MHESVLQRLNGVRRSRVGWMAKCPAHDDKTQSLSVKVGDTGKLLLKCFAGCTFEEVLDALGISPKDCRPEMNDKPAVEVACYVYRDENAEPLYEKVRYEPKDFRLRRVNEDGSREWGIGTCRRVLYNLNEIVRNQGRAVLFVEGEKSCDLLKSMGFLATCSPFGAASEGNAGKWDQGFNESLSGRTVFIFPDNDKSGENHASFVEAQLTSTCTPVIVRLALENPKDDIYDWVISRKDRAECKSELIKACKDAQYLAKRRADALQIADDLAKLPRDLAMEVVIRALERLRK